MDIIQKEIQKSIEKMKKLDELTYAYYGIKRYSNLKKEQKEQINQIYEIYEEEKENIDINIGNIDNVIEDSLFYYELKKKNNGIIGYSTGLEFEKDGKNIDEYINGLIPGKVYTVAGYSNVGKSTFSYYLLSKHLDKKILFFSTEVNKGLVLQNIMKSKYNISFIETLDYLNNNKNKVKDDFKNLYVFDDIKEIQIIRKIIEKMKPDIVVLDFVQGLKAGYTDLYTQNAYIAREIQAIAIEYKIIMLSVAQITATARKEAGKGVFSIKGAGEYFESSDVVFHILRRDIEEPEDIELIIEKNKFGPLVSFELKADYKNGQFNIMNEINF